MKKLLYIFTTVLIVACSNEPVFSSDDGLYRWSFKLDGQLYEWEGTLSNDPNNLGASLYGDGLLTLGSQSSSGSEGISVTCMFPTINTGNFTFDSTDNFQISFNDTNLLSSTIYSTILYGGQINVNISSLSNNTVVENPFNPGKVIGTFDGVIEGKIIPVGSAPSDVTGIITEGVFEAVRTN